MILITIFGVAALGANHWIVKSSLPTGAKTADLIAGMELLHEVAEIELAKAGSPNPNALDPGETRWQRILRTKQLRVGYVPNSAPYCFANSSGRIVGFDIDLIQGLAADAGAKLVLVPVQRQDIFAGFDADQFDLAVGEIASSLSHQGKFFEAGPYLENHAALLVPDHMAAHYQSLATIQARQRIRIATERGGLMLRTHRFDLPGIEPVEIDAALPWLEGKLQGIDALLTTAERGAVMAIVHPEFSVVIPEGVDIGVPLIVATARSQGLRDAVNTWLGLKKADGSIGDIYDHWILGKDLDKKSQHKRWCVIRDVLGWVK